MKKFLSLFLLSIFLSLNGFALEKSHKEEAPLKVSIIAEEESIQPGRPFWVGVRLDISEGWDTYWINPGEAGLPTQVNWQLPEGFKASELQWPQPEEFSSQELKAFGYTHSVTLLAQITPTSDTSLQNAEISANVTWLACKEACVPGESKISLNLPVKSEAPRINENTKAQFAEARAAIPLAKNEGLSFAKESQKLILNFALNTHDVEKAYFFPEVGGLIDYHAPQELKKAAHSYRLDLPLTSDGKSLPDRVKGVLVVSEKDSPSQAIAIDLPIKSVSIFNYKFFGALLGAFLGGLILNVMPCVLPVLALKVMSFVKMAGEARSSLFKHSGAFTMGVLLSFWALTALLFILRAAGSHIGWGFQLQEPLFVGILVGLLFLFSLSLFGLFEIGTSLMSVGSEKERSPLGKAFFNGVLATLVATPCTGPLLGPALGFAITLPYLQSFSIFTAMALGMASPYFIFALFPSLLRFLPKPGAWMNIFKQIMGFLLVGSSLWLLWVFAAQSSLNSTFILLGALFILSIAAWIYGKWGTPLMKKTKRRGAKAASFLLLILAMGAIIEAPKVFPREETLSIESKDWQAFSPEKVLDSREEGKAVFIDFTAKWCLICQANKVALHSPEVMQAFAEKNVVTLTADWTRRNEEITQILHDLGRTGVPVYVLYPKGLDEKPIILPQTLSKSIVLDYLNRLK